MPSHRMSMSFTSPSDALGSVTKVLAKHQSDDYFTYERDGHWYIGLGSQSSLLIDPKGETITVITGAEETSRAVDKTSTTDIVRDFIYENSKYGSKIHGQVGFNYAALIRGQTFNHGRWPLLSLMVPRNEITVCQHDVTVAGYDEEEVQNLYSLIKHDTPSFDLDYSRNNVNINTQDTADKYTGLVKKALSDIAQGQYTKVIASRVVEIGHKVDMPATLLLGRRSNNPARSFSFNHNGHEATGFSPELVLSVKKGKVVTEPLAGTRSCEGTNEEIAQLRQELLNDPKEVLEHVVSVKEAIEELGRLCPPDSITVEDLMSVRARGSVQHIGSRVGGMLSPDKDIWDAFDVLFPSITACGIPKNAAIEAIQRLEDRPRELYSGAILLVEGLETMEAALVLRSAFQDTSRQWIQAGAGIILQSNPQRELRETHEKLASIAPFVVPKAA
ncbi:hypothetical protein N7532_010983 [Penicillium argentinense]|uniref:Chorismate-utilising enzyme C-terminal domain-containing protein n=1 Tax=Penicillium argentinense TaxID=1131581 RepID=A0A9W9EQM0_9EURO|nr:uncharacterized protein N7532_010983 [Penicillium argentinense]KAJ5086212.1 hypothetical protein N7532_010983 [Penicillium argentinense]